jgi:methyl-accepting chemotaxis protein
MASTTEELSSQSDQLVSSLAFFRTGDEGHSAAARSGGAKAVKHAEPAAGKPAKAASHGAPLAKKAAAGAGGVNLKLKDKGDDLDKEFERY